MKALFEIFLNECRAVLRSKSLLMLLAASVAWMFAAPRLFTGDGTTEGFRQMYLHYSLGGVAALLSVCLMIAATGSIAKERAAKRLALTMVRPVRYFHIAFGKMLALVSCGALVLAVAAGIEYFRTDDVPCRHVLKPVMPSVMEEAEAMYASYMARSNTPEQVRKADKSVVLRILAARARDYYDTIATNAVHTWRFHVPEGVGEGASVRLRFSTMFDQRDEVSGVLAIDGRCGIVSNITQAVIEVPLDRPGSAATDGLLTFRNDGANQVMLRPRRDVELMVPADSFGRNLFRAYLQLVSMLALLVAFGIFLGSALGRPSALFTAITMLLLSEMAPSVMDSYIDELETNKVDAIGLVITRASAYVTQPVSSIAPLESLSLDECVEPRETLRILIVDMIFLPLALAFLSSLIMPRKQEF